MLSMIKCKNIHRSINAREGYAKMQKKENDLRPPYIHKKRSSIWSKVIR